jgi:hypothetical protein
MSYPAVVLAMFAGRMALAAAYVVSPTRPPATPPAGDSDRACSF